MASATIEVTGPDAERRAAALQARLQMAAGPGERVAAVEVVRSAELLIAVIGLVFSGVGAAKTIWDWWRPQQAEPVTVRILLADGAQVDLSAIDQDQLETELARRTSGQR